MRRTYRSKKDTGGGLAPKDLLTYVDTKSSVFDAYYIQNIKQTKREMSCLNLSHHTEAIYKINKKKYVKRIKDISLREEMVGRGDSPVSGCAYLTPDKSIHVNKPPDPFDLLLKSSPTFVQSPKLLSKTTKNTYVKKKQTLMKKFEKNSSDSDKENSGWELSELSENISNINNHELFIEKVNSKDVKGQDDSIKNIENQMSFLANIYKSGPSNGIVQLQRMAALKNQNPLSNSPLCSTPFQQKCRSKSIFNLSPISFNLANSPILSENCPNKISYALFENDKMQDSCECLSPKSRQCIVALNLSCNDTNAYLNNDSLKVNSLKIEESNRRNSVRKRAFVSSLCTTETEPFYGFRNVSNFEEYSQKNDENLCPKMEGIKPSPENATTVNSSSEQSISSISSHCNKSYETSIENNESSSFYDTCGSGKLISKSDSICRNICSSPRVIIERMDNSLFYKYYKGMDAPISNLEVSTSGAEELSNDFHSNASSDEQQMPGDILDGYFNSEENIDCASHNCKDKRESTDSDIECDMKAEEDICISFVTTRRGNRVMNTSIVFIDNNTSSQSCSSYIDKCVLPSSELISSNTYETNLDNISIESKSIISINNTIYGETIESDAKPSTSEIQKSCEQNIFEPKPNEDVGHDKAIVLQPGKKWERSLSIYKRMTAIADNFDHTILDDETSKYKGRRYRQSVINTMELQKLGGSLHNDSINGRRSTFMKPSRSTIKIVKENRTSISNLCSSAVYDDLKGFLSEDCDDTIVDLSKLSIDDSVQEVTVLEKFHDTSRIASARDYVLRRCNQTEAILFDECYPDTELKNCHKIGEGVYGEVFLWRARDGQARVLKIIPIAGDIKVNGEPQKGFHEIISEIVIAMELSALRSPIAAIEKLLDEGKDIDTLDLHSVENATDIFNEVIAVRCVRGAYPARLLDLWELFDECRGSDNDSPALLPSHQHYAVLELANAGQDLESYHFNNAEQAHALFLQVALGLAVGEEALQFEHRDLHWGNVLVAPCERRWAVGVVRGRALRVPLRGVRATLIDYSLSRLSLRGGALFADLAHDEALFDAVGDRQFAVYRLMRERLANDWSAYDPFTNLLWLHYLLDKMLTALRYKRTNTKVHKHFIAKLKALKNRILDYGSVAHFVLTDDEF